MGLNIAGTTVVVETDILKVKDSSAVTHLSFDGAGRLKRGTAHPMFYVCNTTAAWTAITANAWTEIPWNNAIVNQGGGFNTSTGRYTAPVTGVYLISSNLYTYNPSGGYSHVMYAVNGSVGGRRFSGNGNYRIRGHGLTAGYGSDHDISETYYLYAGDYISYYSYAGTSCSYYGVYGHFAGWLIG